MMESSKLGAATGSKQKWERVCDADFKTGFRGAQSHYDNDCGTTGTKLAIALDG
ncbi:hypothetical protein [Calothrix sp. PCC 6303]|uniref:hypothetical protein n=1 Tax=Calothrix sp. PCC 6303 TaxID=1170562 RepID=UPI0002A053CA|nr:hypothetical protein [Calothrix sp. PCC 6303]AFZ02199.1 hypothetical protein Cal6303_3258 [Calothrix sp. PCC 6303]